MRRIIISRMLSRKGSHLKCWGPGVQEVTKNRRVRVRDASAIVREAFGFWTLLSSRIKRVKSLRHGSCGGCHLCNCCCLWSVVSSSRVKNGEWMDCGEWKMDGVENGEWKMEIREWKLESGEWGLET